MKVLPQEIELYYLIPAVRRELSKILIHDFSLSQKQVADILGVTESAVSQYVKSKRARELKFTKEEISEIRKTAHVIIQDKKNCNKHIFDLTLKFRGADNICKIHRKFDKSISGDCKICVQ